MSEGVSVDVIPAPAVPAPNAAPPASETATNTPSEEVLDGEQQTEETPEQKAERQAKPTNLPKDVQKRIDRAVRQKYEAEARSKVLEERLSHLERAAPQAAETPAVAQKPTLEEFGYDYEKYADAISEWKADQKITKVLSEAQKHADAERHRQAAAQTQTDWNKRVASALKEMPDYNDVVSESETPLTPTMRQAIMESDAGPKLAYYLASHPDEAEAIAASTPLKAVRALMRIEDSFSVKQTTSTPAPISPTGSRSTTAVKSLTDPMSQNEFEKRRRAFLAKR